MARRVMCEVCNAAIHDAEKTTLHIQMKAAPRQGIPMPDVKIEADLCSPSCFRAYLRQYAASAIEQQVERHGRIVGGPYAAMGKKLKE